MDALGSQVLEDLIFRQVRYGGIQSQEAESDENDEQSADSNDCASRGDNSWRDDHPPDAIIFNLKQIVDQWTPMQANAKSIFEVKSSSLMQEERRSRNQD